MNPREKRLLKILIERDKVFIRDLRELIGSQNPAQIKFQLKNCGWQIHTDFIPVKDRDGELCPASFYWIDEKEKQKAIECLKIDEAGAAASSIKNNEKFNMLNFMQNHITKGGKNEQPS